MTIAVGVLARTGVVIAADSQETVQGYWKTNQGKVWRSGLYAPESVGCCAVAAAGRAGYCDSLTSDILQAFNANPGVVTNSDVKALIGSQTAAFHREHVAPYHDASDLEVECVVAYERNNAWGLFQTDRGSVLRSGNYVTVGVGRNEASAALRGLIRTPPELRAAIIAAAYGVFMAKERVDGCGNFTDIAYLTNHQTYAVSRETSALLEQSFRRWNDFVVKPMLATILGGQDSGVTGFNAAIETIRRDISAIDMPIPPFQPFTPAAVQPSAQPTKRGRKPRRPSQA